MIGLLKTTRRLVPLVAMALALATASRAWAQCSSMYGDPSRRQPLTLATNSWTYRTVEPPPEIELYDIITIIVDEKSQVISEGEMDRRKKSNFNAVLKDWVLLRNWNLIPDPQSKGDPTISAEWNNKLRSEAGMETQEAMKSRIACRVVDIRPNGNLVLEGHSSIRVNSEAWDFSLTGEIRPDDVQPNNTVLSENVANLRIHKREEGHTRDGYRRGWLLKFLDTYQPF